MFSNGFLIRATITVIDHRPPHEAARPRKHIVETHVAPGENLYTAIRDTLSKTTEKVVSDVAASPIGQRAKQLGEETGK